MMESLRKHFKSNMDFRKYFIVLILTVAMFITAIVYQNQAVPKFNKHIYNNADKVATDKTINNKMSVMGALSKKSENNKITAKSLVDTATTEIKRKKKGHLAVDAVRKKIESRKMTTKTSITTVTAEIRKKKKVHLAVGAFTKPNENNKITTKTPIGAATTNIKRKKKVLLVVGVLSALTRHDRRKNIRATWFQQCQANPDIVQCRFFTDQLTNSTEKISQRENNENGQDMLFMPIKGGIYFGQRLVWMMQWFAENYEFDFLLRVDDDYFLCMNRLLLELPHRPKTGLYWGWVHCANNMVRVDEGWMILTKDIIEEALSKYNTTLLCHPFGDQAVPIWVRDSKLPITWFADNNRLIHAATSYLSGFMIKDLCEKYLGLHGTYKDKMIQYWNVSESKVLRFHENSNSKQFKYSIPAIPNFRDVCKADMNFNVSSFGPGLTFEHKLCKYFPNWSITSSFYPGRERDQ